MTANQGKYIEQHLAVPSAYADIFAHFYIARNKSDQLISKTLLPSFQTILVFNFGAKAYFQSKNNTKIKMDKCLVLGPIKQAFNYSLPPNAEILVVNFKKDAFYRFFGQATVADYLPINPDSLFHENCFTALWKQLNNTNDIHHQVNTLLEYCKPYLKQGNKIAEKLASFGDKNLNPIKSIAIEQGQTERNIQHYHKKHLGYTFKEINRYQRFMKAIELIQDITVNSKKIDWFKIINDCDYYDQSQLIHDFKYYLNISPTKYLKFQQDICVAKMT